MESEIELSQCEMLVGSNIVEVESIVNPSSSECNVINVDEDPDRQENEVHSHRLINIFQGLLQNIQTLCYRIISQAQDRFRSSHQ